MSLPEGTSHRRTRVSPPVERSDLLSALKRNLPQPGLMVSGPFRAGRGRLPEEGRRTGRSEPLRRVRSSVAPQAGPLGAMAAMRASAFLAETPRSPRPRRLIRLPVAASATPLSAWRSLPSTRRLPYRPMPSQALLCRPKPGPPVERSRASKGREPPAPTGPQEWPLVGPRKSNSAPA